MNNTSDKKKRKANRFYATYTKDNLISLVRISAQKLPLEGENRFLFQAKSMESELLI